MADKDLEDWVRQKIEEGKSKEALKKVLEKRGHNPNLVDQVSPQENTVQKEGSEKKEVAKNNGPDHDKAKTRQTVKSFETKNSDDVETSLDKKDIAYYLTVFVLSVVLGVLLGDIFL